jgi:putative Holliday junction resolvase
MRFLGIDYGTRRIGLAAGDELGIATPLPALVESDLAVRRRALATLVRQRRIDELVLGYPLNMDGSAGFKAKEMEALAVELRAEFGLPVHLVDERLTSHLAETGMNQKQLREIRAKGIIDSRAAAVILQDYLDQRFPPSLVSAPEDL